MPHICVSELGQHWFRKWHGACSAPSHSLNQCCLVVNWTFRNKRQWNLIQNTKLFIHENAFENVACETADVLSRRRWVNLANSLSLLRNTTLLPEPVLSYWAVAFTKDKFNLENECEIFLFEITASANVSNTVLKWKSGYYTDEAIFDQMAVSIYDWNTLLCPGHTKRFRERISGIASFQAWI